MSKVIVGIFFAVFLFFIFQGIFGFMQKAFGELDHSFHAEVSHISLDE